MTAEHDAVTDYEIETDAFPLDLLVEDRWFVWSLTDDGRKIPRAPWANPDRMDKYVSYKDPDNWVDFETADEWVNKFTRYDHASCVTNHENNSEERLIFFDFDDVRDPETEAIHGQAWAFIEKYDLAAFISTSGTGVHGFGRGTLPENYKPSFEIDLPEWEYGSDAELEVYASARFIALTGEHIVSTPQSAAELGETAHELFRKKGKKRTTGTEREPDIDREEIANTDTTDDLDVIYDAIAHTRPRDIRLRSTKTEEYNRGSDEPNCARDPSWASSKSGTRLAEFDDHWLYRKGNHNLDALQVVALEERIIHSESDYPSGDDFVDAVEELRSRGADIPELERQSHEFDVVADDNETTPTGSDAVKSETDGGTVTADADSDTGPVMNRDERFKNEVREHIEEMATDDEMTQRTVRHRISESLCDHYNFVRPEEEVRGWRTKLYSYDGESGIYEPRGDTQIERLLERAAGDYVTNQVVNEIQGKVGRRTTERGPQFEKEPERIVVEDGVLDLHTGELESASPSEYHRTTVPPKWDTPVEEPDAIDDFFHEIVDDKDVDTLYRLVAHTLYKEYIGEKAAILIGSGQNGKSMFLNLVEEFVGKFNVTHRELQDFDAQGYAANNLEGKLANLATELGEQRLRDATIFKKLTGRDTLDADVKYEKPITFENHATLMFATNEMPVFGQDNHAIWRRWVYVEFPYEFSKTGDKDPVEKNKLMRRLTQPKEMQGLLKRAQREIQRWHETDEDFFEDSMDPDKLRDKMKKAAEPVFNFATTCLRIGDSDDSYVKKADVREAYRAYADAEDLPTLDETTFGERLIQIRDFQIEPGQKRIDGTRTPVYRGIELSPRGRQVTGADEPDSDSGQSTVEYEQAEPIVMDELRTMVENNDGQPVSRNALAWRAAGGQMGKQTAENAIDNLAKKGEVIDGSDGLMPTSK
jgi:P4 family phage/plasmid primase-like protien